MESPLDASSLLSNTVVTLFSILSAAVGAIFASWWTSRREKVQVTMQLFRDFHDADLHAARIVASKHFIDHPTGPITFDTLWETEDTVPVYQALARTVYFFFELSSLHKAGMIDRRLAKQLFHYAYGYWHPMLERLHRDTVAEGSTDQDWLVIIGESQLTWLMRKPPLAKDRD